VVGLAAGVTAMNYGARQMDWSVSYHPKLGIGGRAAYPDRRQEYPGDAQCIAVGNLVFASASPDHDTPRQIEDQVNAVLDRIRVAMETAGSSMDNIVKTFFLIRNLDDYAKVRKTETEYYEKHAPQLVTTPPAATLMVVPSLARSEFLAGYEVIGVIDRNMPDWPVKYFAEYWAGKELAYPHVPKEHAKFARSQVVGNLVIISGCQALDHETVRVETSDFSEQTRIVLDKIKTAMEETGGSMENVVKTNVFVKDIGELERYREVERGYFRAHAPALLAHPPASTVFVVHELPRPEFLVEVEAFGVTDRTAPGWTTSYCQGSPEASDSASAGRLLFLSGCDGLDAGDGAVAASLERQVTAALGKVRVRLDKAGSAMDKVIKTAVMLKDLNDYPKMRATELEYYRNHAPRLVSNPPVSTFMQLPAAKGGQALFQIDVTAVL
jgi:enamine deaminase RidA (YjgF/YER057c/UK114 family)